MKKRVLPPEWAEQEYIQLTWPHAGSDWAPYLCEAVACFKEIAKAILKYENLIVVCVNETEVKEVLKDLDLNRISFFETKTNDTWARIMAELLLLKMERELFMISCLMAGVLNLLQITII